MEPLLGTIIIFAGTFAPKGWALCDGQLVSIAQNSTLFSLIGNYYGGDGIVTFALPDLRGRAPIHVGHGPGLSVRVLGETVGTEAELLVPEQLPAHSHDLNVSNADADSSRPNGLALARAQIYSATVTDPLAKLDARSVGATGGGQAHNNMQPSLAVNYIIAMEGIYPSRP